MADDTLEIKIDVITKAVQEGLKNVENAIGHLGSFIKDGNQASTKSFEDLAKNISKSLNETFKNVGKEAKESAKNIEKSWTDALSRIVVLKETIAGFGKYFNELSQGPRLMETAMASLSFVSKEVKNNYNDVRDSLLAMGRSMPIKSTTELVGAMKDLATDGYSMQDSLKLTELAAKGAVAGLTDTATSLGGLKNIMSAYNMEVDKATNVQDLLFKSVQLTGENYGELSNGIASVIPSISAMGIEFDSFIGGVTALSGLNVPVSQSIGIMEQAAKQLTLVLGESYMKTNSITDAMKAVYEKSNGELEKIIKTVGKPELAKAILMIGQNADSVQDSLIEMGLAAGTAEKAFENGAGTTDNMIQTIQNNLNDIKETLVTNLLPAINAIVGVVKDILQLKSCF
jgi:TP901 family phage tail tape measure protein